MGICGYIVVPFSRLQSLALVSRVVQGRHISSRKNIFEQRVAQTVEQHRRLVRREKFKDASLLLKNATVAVGESGYVILTLREPP